MPSEIEARGRSLEKTDGYVLKKANVIIERRRMIMKVLVSALFAVAVIISPALLMNERMPTRASNVGQRHSTLGTSNR
jgi:hypothetical protein